MKKTVFIFLLLLFALKDPAQILFTYGSVPVTKLEFLRAFNKNKNAADEKTKAVREYLDLYIKFKLKVQAAKDMRLDTLTSLKNDLQNFRSQIEESYLNDENRLNALMDEAFLRSQKDIHVSFWMVPLNGADSVGPMNTANDLYKNLLSGNPVKTGAGVTNSDIGFITVFNLPYDYENIVYNLKPGEISKPFHAKNGYFIFKNAGERKAVGKIKVAQILISVPEGAGQQEKDKAARLADSIYHAVIAGTDFAEMAKKFSEDKMTYMSGGVLPDFGVGKYDPAFEEKAFGLQKDGDITPPFQTQFGYHILKRLLRPGITTDKSDAVYLYSIKQQVQQDSRVNAAKEKFVNDVLKKLNFKKSSYNEPALWKVTDSFLVSNKKIMTPPLNDKTILFSLGNSKIKVSDWLKFVKDYRASGLYKGESNKELFNKYISLTALNNYRKHLADFNPDFRFQLQEFKEGNMLFEVMERNVWTKASADTNGLKNFYEQHKSKYLWNASADAILISAGNESSAKEAAGKLKSGTSWHQLSENNAQVQTDSGRYELAQLPLNPGLQPAAGAISDPIINTTDGTTSFVQVLKIYPVNQQRTFEEARGLVINDYQNYLEEKWITQLKKKYPVKVNETVVKSLL